MAPGRPRFARKYRISAAGRHAHLQLSQNEAILLSVEHAPGVCRDPDDDYLLGRVAAGGMEYLVTGDDDHRAWTASWEVPDRRCAALPHRARGVEPTDDCGARPDRRPTRSARSPPRRRTRRTRPARAEVMRERQLAPAVDAGDLALALLLRSWSQHSKSMRRPEAPMGWPKDLRPPSGFTASSPSRSKVPARTSFEPHGRQREGDGHRRRAPRGDSPAVPRRQAQRSSRVGPASHAAMPGRRRRPQPAAWCADG